MISAVRKEEHDARPAWLWAKRQPITGTLTKHYLRAVYGITCAPPPTLGYLPPNGPHHAAVIVDFDMAEEIEPRITLRTVKRPVSSLLRSAPRVWGGLSMHDRGSAGNCVSLLLRRAPTDRGDEWAAAFMREPTSKQPNKKAKRSTKKPTADNGAVVS